MILTLVRGLPGSGKSTYAARMGCFHVESDMFRYRDGLYRFDWGEMWRPNNMCMVFTQLALGFGVDVVVSDPFVTLEEMEPYRTVADVEGATLEVIKMTGNYGSGHDWNEQVIAIMRAQWQDCPGEEVVM